MQCAVKFLIRITCLCGLCLRQTDLAAFRRLRLEAHFAYSIRSRLGGTLLVLLAAVQLEPLQTEHSLKNLVVLTLAHQLKRGGVPVRLLVRAALSFKLIAPTTI